MVSLGELYRIRSKWVSETSAFCHGFIARESVICGSWIFFRIENFTKDENVWIASEWIWEDSHWFQIAIRIGALSCKGMKT